MFSCLFHIGYSHTLDEVSRQMGTISKPGGGHDLKEIEQEMAEVEVLTEEETKGMENAFKNNMMNNASKMQGIFTKAQSNYDNVVESLEGLKTVPIEDPSEVMKKEKLEDSEKEKQMMLTPLQIKITKLKDDVEMAHSKARSSEIQR